MSDLFGILGDGTAVERHVLRSDRLEVAVLSYGGVLQSVSAPDRDGARADVVLGFDDLGDYVEKSPFFGALVGRYANRIAGARFSLNGRSYELPANNGPNTLHGGPSSFDAKIWTVKPVESPMALDLATTAVLLEMSGPVGAVFPETIAFSRTTAPGPPAEPIPPPAPELVFPTRVLP